uniref:Transposase (putative) gypsy type domain-containing protein n=1 Tax=Tanacetum cinerariifolium TaxID=118510 RepID=A0A699IZ57_TANCI|nr:hypothetical protein [Tanacetum cinerariifolium]
MFELLDDAIGVYHCIFDFFGVRIPFSSFLLALIKHYKVYFTQLGPLGLNKVITFEVLCRSLLYLGYQTLFRVFQTLCKKGDWFSSPKRCAPCSVFIVNNRSFMKHWKSGLFFIDRRVILDYITWRHPDLAIDDHKPIAGSYERRILMIQCSGEPMEMLWVFTIFSAVLSRLGLKYKRSPHHDVRPTLHRLPFYCTPPATIGDAIPDSTPEELAVSNPSTKVIAKAEDSSKRKASTYGFASGHVAKHTSGDDDDVCYEILIVTPIRSAAVIPFLRNQGRGYASPAIEGLSTRDSQGKGIMTDADTAVALPVDASHPRVSSGSVPSFREISGDVIHRDFFLFSPSPYYATYLEGSDQGSFQGSLCLQDCGGLISDTRGNGLDQALSSDQLTAKMSDLHCLMMSHGGKLLAWYRGLLQSHHEYVQSTDSRLKGYLEKFASLTGFESQATVLEAEKDEEILCLKATHSVFASFFHGQIQALVWKFLTSDEFSRVHAKLLSLAASTGLCLEQPDRLAEASPLVAQTDYAFLNKIFEHAAKPLSVILQLETEKLARPANVPASRDACVSPPIAKKSTLTLSSTSLESLSNTVHSSSTAALKSNEGWVNAMVDGPNHEIVDGAANAKPENVFVQGVTHVIYDATELSVTGSECDFYGPGDVVVPFLLKRKVMVLLLLLPLKRRGTWYAGEYLLLRAWGN